jgi:hypothetical protein
MDANDKAKTGSGAGFLRSPFGELVPGSEN